MEQTETGVQKRSRRSWYFYDFGNSAYASIILLAVYSVYFKDTVVGGAAGTRLWGLSVGIAAAVVAVMSPILGAIADFTRFKKKFLIAFTTLSVVFTALLFFVHADDVFMGMLFFILAEIGYRASQVFYDALLSDVSTPENIGAVSGKGWAIGMLGGILALLLVLPIMLVKSADLRPYAFLICAVFFTVSAIPTFLWVKESRNAPGRPVGERVIVYAFKNLAKTFRAVKSYKEFIKYTVAFLIYNDGIMMLMDFAAIIGGTLYGLNTMQLIILVVVLQITGALGALLFGRIADRRSGKGAVLASLIILVAAISALFFIPPFTPPAGYTSPLTDIFTVASMRWFLVVGAVAGFSLSGAQAVSRSMVIQFAPPEKTTEFFGFLSVAGRTSTFVGPLVFGTLTFRMHNFYVNQGLDAGIAEKYGTLWGIGSIILFLVVGGLLLLFVKRISGGRGRGQ
ncbi:MAG: MFS transporter [Firmicutes bacterium]|nr:MFS transporter [Bacillota bacterium]